MDTKAIAAARVHRFLETEPVIWLSSTSVDGGPHLVPSWSAKRAGCVRFEPFQGHGEVRAPEPQAEVVAAVVEL